MRWTISDRFDPQALPIADRHYNRQHVGSPQFVPPGACIVLRHENALWVTSWPKAEYTRHAWAGAWVNSTFRKECDGLASEFITDAIGCTKYFWPAPPPLGLITFINESKVRHKRDVGRCYLRAGFRPAICPKHGGSDPNCMACKSRTQAGLLAFQMFPDAMPSAMVPRGVTENLFAGAGV